MFKPEIVSAKVAPWIGVSARKTAGKGSQLKPNGVGEFRPGGIAMLHLDSAKVREIVAAWLVVGAFLLALVVYANFVHESVIDAEQTAGFYAA